MSEPSRAGDPSGKGEGVVRAEEELRIGVERHPAGVARLRTVVDTEHVREEVPVLVEEASVERVPPDPDDDGEVHTLADGALSVPVLEEELVVTRRTVVRERVVVRKAATRSPRVVEADLRRQRVEVEIEDEVEDGGLVTTVGDDVADDRSGHP